MFMCPERSFSTSEIAPAKRLGAWQEMISDVFFKVDIDGAKVEDDWRASIDEVWLGDLGLSTYATESALPGSIAGGGNTGGLRSHRPPQCGDGCLLPGRSGRSTGCGACIGRTLAQGRTDQLHRWCTVW